ncbi:MAG TPA: D-aminoacyl-tRNA deacylase [Candidatus Didemnitutus sp.]
MRLVVQRVLSASVTIDGIVGSAIGPGLLVLAGIAVGDTEADGAWLAEKMVKLRIFPDDDGRMNRSVVEVGGGILAISQFTLHASTRKGTRPSFNAAASPEVAEPLYETFVAQLTSALGHPVATGRFGADMKVALVNDGPVTLVLDSRMRK